MYHIDIPADKVRKEWEKDQFTEVDQRILASLLLVGSLLFLVRLGHRPLWQWDEAIYANAARHMVRNGEWVIPHVEWHPQRSDIYLRPFLEKPPLVMWLQGLSMSLFGVTRFAARLPTAVLTVLSGLLIYQFGRSLFDRVAGFVAAVVFFTTPLVFATMDVGGHGGRTGNTDIPLLFFGTLFVYCMYLSLARDRPALLPYAGVAAGLAVLAKGFQAGIFLVVVAPLVLLQYRTLLSRYTVLSAGIVALLTVPWSAYAWIRHGQEFVDQIFVEQVLSRATGEQFRADGGGLFSFMRYPYFQEFPTAFDPWVYLLLPAAAIVLYYGWQSQNLGGPLLLVWWATSVLGFFALTGNQLWYIMPIAVPCALLLGGAGGQLSKRRQGAVIGITLGAAALLWFNGISLATVAVLFGILVVWLRDRCGEVLSTVAGAGRSTLGKRGLPLLAILVLLVSLTAPTVSAFDTVTYSDEERLGQLAADEVPEGETIAIEDGVYHDRLFTFAFHADRSLVSLWTGQLNRNQDIQYAVVLTERLSELERDYRVIDEHQRASFIEFRDGGESDL